MRRMTLAEFASQKGQTKAAVLLGMAQSALNKAIHSGRDIRVTRQKDGSFTAEEVRPFPSRTKSQAA